jgi:hypothetical protein
VIIADINTALNTTNALRLLELLWLSTYLPIVAIAVINRLNFQTFLFMKKALLVIKSEDDLIRVSGLISESDQKRMVEIITGQENVAIHIKVPQLIVLFKTKSGSLIHLCSTQ